MDGVSSDVVEESCPFFWYWVDPLADADFDE
jgi:hypothetical protein